MVQVVAEINGWGMGGDFIVDDTANYFGVNPLATDEYDGEFDIPESPPPPGNFILFYFPHYDWDVPFGEKFTQDIRFENEPILNGNGINWEGELYSEMDGEASLVFILEEDFPECLVNIIIDEENFNIVNGDTVFTSINAFQEKSVLINVNSCDYHENIIINNLPPSINNLSAFPNPFNNIIVFEYTIFNLDLLQFKSLM